MSCRDECTVPRHIAEQADLFFGGVTARLLVPPWRQELGNASDTAEADMMEKLEYTRREVKLWC